MVEAEFSFFKVEIKGLFRDAVELCQPSFCVAPEALDTVDMSFSTGKLISAMIDSKMLVEADIDQAIVPTPAIRMDDRGGIDVAPDNALERSFGAIGNDLGIDLSLPFQQTKHNGFAVSTTPSFASYPMRPKVGFVHFDCALKRRGQLTGLGNPMSNLQKDRVRRTQRNSRQFCCIRGRKIHGKTADQLPKFRLADSRTSVVPVFSKHLSKLAPLFMCLTS